jgi:hypothetical protein
MAKLKAKTFRVIGAGTTCRIMPGGGRWETLLNGVALVLAPIDAPDATINMFTTNQEFALKYLTCGTKVRIG